MGLLINAGSHLRVELLEVVNGQDDQEYEDGCRVKKMLGISYGWATATPNSLGTGLLNFIVDSIEE